MDTFKYILIIILIVAGLIGTLGYFVYRQQPISIQHVYPGKVVYTTDVDQDQSEFRKECEARQGTFSECGDICPKNTAVCAELCAFTCEFNE